MASAKAASSAASGEGRGRAGGSKDVVEAEVGQAERRQGERDPRRARRAPPRSTATTRTSWAAEAEPPWLLVAPEREPRADAGAPAAPELVAAGVALDVPALSCSPLDRCRQLGDERLERVGETAEAGGAHERLDRLGEHGQLREQRLGDLHDLGGGHAGGLVAPRREALGRSRSAEPAARRAAATIGPSWAASVVEERARGRGARGARTAGWRGRVPGRRERSADRHGGEERDGDPGGGAAHGGSSPGGDEM